MQLRQDGTVVALSILSATIVFQYFLNCQQFNKTFSSFLILKYHLYMHSMLYAQISQVLTSLLFKGSTFK